MMLARATSLVNSVLHLHRRSDLRFTDVAVATGLSNRATQVALQTLVKHGVAERQTLAGATIFRPLTDGAEGRAMRLLAIAALDPEQLWEEQLLRITYVGLYGSLARGNERPDSDLDLLVLGNPRKEEMQRHLGLLEHRYERTVDLAVYPTTQFIEAMVEGDAFVLNMIKELVPLWGDLPHA